MAKRLLTVSEAAERLGVSARTLRRWDREGKLRAWRDPTNDYRLYDPDDLAAIKPHAASATGLVGRDRELAAVRDAFQRSPAVVLTGLPGIGKTAIAQTFGAGQDAVLATYDETMDDAEQLDAIREKLTAPEPLVVLDGWPSDAPLEPWRRAIPSARWLVTSWWAPSDREAVAIPVPSLELESAVQLLVRRAAQWGVNLEPDASVQRLAALLDGHPLAIELAAMQTPLLEADALAELIATEPGALASDRRDAPERHRSLAAAFGPAFEALDRDQRAVLATVVLFRGGADPDSVAAVAGLPSSRVDGALDILRARGWATEGGLERVHPHPILRLAVSGLEASAQLVGAYARHFADLADRDVPALHRRERLNLDAVLDRVPASEYAARILIATTGFAERAGAVHARRLTVALEGARGRGDRIAIARLAARLGEVELAAQQTVDDPRASWEVELASAWSGPDAALRELAERAARAGWPREEASARTRLADRALDRGDSAAAIEDFTLASERSAARSDRLAYGEARLGIARAQLERGELEAVDDELGALEDVITTPGWIGAAEAAWIVGALRIEQSRNDEAARALATCTQLAISLEHEPLQARSALARARLDISTGAMDSAWQYAEHARAGAQRSGDGPTAARALGLRGLAAIEYAPATALDALRASATALREHGLRRDAAVADAWAWIAGDSFPANIDEEPSIAAVLREFTSHDIGALHDALAHAETGGSVPRLTAALVRHSLRVRGLPVRTLEIGPAAEWVVFERQRLDLRSKARLRSVLLSIVESGDRGAQVEDVLAEVWAGEELEGHVSGHRVHHAVGLLRRLGLACVEHHEGRYRVSVDTRVIRF